MEKRSSYFPKMAIGNGIMRSRRPWVNLFHSPPDQAKRNTTGKSGNAVQILQK
jgi:hypothetical protein